jgi:replicative DNA helicase
LKALARSLDIPVVVSAQLRRDAEGKRPQLSDFSDSTQIERDADVAVMIYQSERKDESKKTYLLVAKNRDGPCRDIEVHFDAAHMRFETVRGVR